MQQHHLNVRNLQGLRDTVNIYEGKQNCAELWSLNDTNGNNLTTATVTLGKEHLVNQTDEKVWEEATIYHWFWK